MKSYLFTIYAVGLVFLLTACQTSPTPKATKTDNKDCESISHALGKTEVCDPPERVVALDSHVLDLLLALEVSPIGYAQPRYVASGNAGQSLDNIRYLGKYLTEPPVNIGTREQPSLETITQLNPDLIVGHGVSGQLHPKLSQIAPTVFPRQNWEAYQTQYSWQRELTLLGQLLNQEQKAQQVIKQHQQRLTQTKEQLKPIRQKHPRVLLLAMSGLNQMSVFTGETFPGTLLTQLGWELVLPKGKTPQYGEIPIGLETLPNLKPDLIIVMASGYTAVEAMEQQWQDHPLLQSLPAWKANNVYFVDYQLWSRIRGPLAAEQIFTQLQQQFPAN